MNDSDSIIKCFRVKKLLYIKECTEKSMCFQLKIVWTPTIQRNSLGYPKWIWISRPKNTRVDKTRLARKSANEYLHFVEVRFLSEFSRKIESKYVSIRIIHENWKILLSYAKLKKSTIPTERTRQLDLIKKSQDVAAIWLLHIFRHFDHSLTVFYSYPYPSLSFYYLFL